MKKIRFIFLMIIFIIVAFYAIKVNIATIKTIHPNLWQLVVLSLMLITIFIVSFLAENQIGEMRKIEEDKILVAITSLIEELEYNKKLLGEYIQHSEEGTNITPKDGRISWEWNKPRLGAYERYLIPACRGDLVIAREITSLYDKLESCKTIIETIQHFVATNIIEVKCIEGGMKLFQSEIGRHNQQLYNISKEAKDLIDGIIKKLGRELGSDLDFEVSVIRT